MINIKPSQINSVIGAAILLLLSACGGGGAGDNGNSGFTANTSTNTSTNTNTKPQTSSAASVATSSTESTSSAVSSVTPQMSSSTASQISSSPASTSSISVVSSSATSNSSASRVTIDTTAPTMTPSVEVVFTEYDIIVFSWAAATDNLGVTAYKIYRNQVQIDQIDAADLIYADFNVAPDNTYTYGVSAGDAVGNWSPIKTILAKTQPQPVPPSSSSSSFSSSSSLSSASSKSSSSVSSSSSLSSASSKSSSSVSSSSSLSSASSKSSSSVSSSSSSTPDTTPPSAPNSLFQASVSASQVDIGWISATDNVAVTTYNIYRDNVLLGSVAMNILTFTDKTVQANKLYTYSVEAGDAAGNKSLARKSIFVTTPPEVASGDVTLYWAPPTQREDGSAISSAELGGFLIRYKLKTATDYTFIDINDGSAKSRIITNLTGNYEFQIAAYDANNLYSSFVDLLPH